MQQNCENRREKKLYKKCRLNMKVICQLSNRIHKLESKVILNSLEEESAVEVLTNKISPSLALKLQGEIIFFNRKPKERRWTRNQKITALRLYQRSPTCYNLLRRLFCLPAPRTLNALLNLCSFHVGINQKVFETLKKFKATQVRKDNQYVLMFDTMSIRNHLEYNNKDDRIEGFQDHGTQGRAPQTATHALVFMICGIRIKVKQPISFYFSGSSVTGDRLAALIKEVLYHCFEAEINVIATVCDMDRVNRRALRILGATCQNPSIIIHDRVITTMFNTPHLLKCFRNILIKYDVEHLTRGSSDGTTGKGIAKWEHIQRFYELDNVTPPFVFAPKLGQEHLRPCKIQKMRLELAAQVFSHSVAAGMYTKINHGELPAEAVITANLVAKMDKLFDCVNSNTRDMRRGRPHSTNLQANTPHLELFKEMKKFFQSLELIGCRRKPPSLEGWVWTLNGIEIIWKRLTTKHTKIRSLATRTLQKDPLENLFGCIREYCGSNTNPTTGQFINGIKTAVLSSLVNTGTRKGKCEKDNNLAILDDSKIWLASKQPTNSNESIDLSELKEDINFFFDDSMTEVTAEIQACTIVCGFIIKKNENNCNICNTCLRTSVSEQDLEQLEHSFAKEYSDMKSNLIHASKDLIKCVEYCAVTINEYLDSHSHENNLKHCLSLLDNVNFDFLKCISHRHYMKEYITNSTFFICVKRYCTIKNQQYIEEASATTLRKKLNNIKFA